MATVSRESRRRVRRQFTDVEGEGYQTPRRRRGSRLLLLALLGIGFLWLSPTIVAKTGLLGYIVNSATSDLDGSVDVRSASLGWFSPITLWDVEVRDADGGLVARVPKVVGDRSLLTPVQPSFPEKRLRNGTVHGRLYGTAGAYELAAYGYVGYWPQPTALDLTEPTDPTSVRGVTYARLGVYGASVRGPLLGGLFNVEASFYDSFNDRAGSNPSIPNSQFRGLVGYEHELFPKFQIGLQYYLEYTFKHDELVGNSLWPDYEQHEFRHLITLRLTQFLVLDTLELSVFTFFSPDELDTYIRPRITYKIIEPLAIIVGANLMFGRRDYTFFGQLKENTNVYARLRYSF